MLEDNYFKKHKASSQISTRPPESGTTPSITNKETASEKCSHLPKVTQARSRP